MIKKVKQNKGITLIALVITIIILLILAGISIGVLTGEDGIIARAEEAREQAEIADEKEIIELATVRAMGKDRYGNVTKDYLDTELTESLGSNYNSKEIEEGITVTFTKSKRSYLVDSDGNVIEYIIREPEPEPEASELATLSKMTYGVIEVEFLSEKGYTVTDTPNTPILKDGMEAVYWAKDASGDLDLENSANNIYEIPSDDINFKEENWYKYEAQEEGLDRKNK